MKNAFSILFFFMMMLFLTGKSRAEPFQFDLQAGLDLKYSDNVIYIYNLTTNITTTDGDFFSEPYLTFRFKKKDPLYSQKLFLYVSSDFYSQYTPLNYQTYSLFFEQGVGEKTYFNLKYSLNPYLFVGEEEVSNNGPNVIDTSWSYRLQTLTLSFDKDLVQGYNIYLFWKQAFKEYNAVVAFRTSIAQTFGADLTLRMDRQTTLLAGFSYEINESQKGIRTIGTLNPITFNDNTDYTSPGISVMVIHHFSSADTLRTKYGFKSRHYSADSTDPLHGGRNDQMHNLLISNALKLTSQWTWKLSYELFKRDSNQSYANFTEDTLATGVEYLF